MINLSPLGFGPSSDWNPRETSENFGLRTLVSVSLTLFLDISIKVSFGMTIVTEFVSLFSPLSFSPFPPLCRAIFKVKRSKGMKGNNTRYEDVLWIKNFKCMSQCTFFKNNLSRESRSYIYTTTLNVICANSLWCYIKYIKCSFFRSFYHPTDHQFSFLFFVRFGTSTYLGSRRESRNLDSNFHLIRVKFPPPFV